MQENVEKWVEALESGEFEQTQGALRAGDSYCCLGVACEVYRRETGRGRWIQVEYTDTREFLAEDSPFEEGSVAVMPGPVARYFNIESNPSLMYGSDDGKLKKSLYAAASLNDKGVPFVEIARAIRERYGTAD